MPPLAVVCLASPVYWRDEDELQRAYAAIQRHLGARSTHAVEFHLLYGQVEEKHLARFQGQTLVVLPMSGGVQPLLIALSTVLGHGAVANAYLSGFLPEELSRALLNCNAHPACTDYFAHCRLHGRPVAWLSTGEEFDAFVRASAAVAHLRRARFLRLGETEPWVSNSTRDPDRFRAAFGCDVIPLPADTLYDEFNRVAQDDPDVAALADDWWMAADQQVETTPDDARKAARVAVAMRRLLSTHDADALSMACFAMISALDTTSCLALSTLNDSASTIGACEGDLDAAVTLYLLKQLGADFVWIANPIIHPGCVIDLAHCTAPRRGCGQQLRYRLLRHHESGRGVSRRCGCPAISQ